MTGTSRRAVECLLDMTELTAPVSGIDPAAQQYALYAYLGWLEEQAVEALAPGLPTVDRER